MSTTGMQMSDQVLTEEELQFLEQGSSQMLPETMGKSMSSAGLTTHESARLKKVIETNAQAIENRIRKLQREEEKNWRDLEVVRRHAAIIEEGRTRTNEKKLADQTVAQTKELTRQQNRARATVQRQTNMEQRRRNEFAQMREKQVAGEEQRRTSQDISRQKKMNDAQIRLQNSERAFAIQRAQLEARLKVNQEKASKLERMREQQEIERQQAEQKVADVESRLPGLEEQELLSLQRLQNSRIVTLAALEELESSLGSKSSVTSLLRSKQRVQDGSSLESPGRISSRTLPMTPSLGEEQSN